MFIQDTLNLGMNKINMVGQQPHNVGTRQHRRGGVSAWFWGELELPETGAI